MPLVTVWPTPNGLPMASTRSPTCGVERVSMAMVGRVAPPGSIFSTATSAWASSSRTLAGNWRRSDSTTMISWPPSITW